MNDGLFEKVVKTFTFDEHFHIYVYFCNSLCNLEVGKVSCQVYLTYQCFFMSSEGHLHLLLLFDKRTALLTGSISSVSYILEWKGQENNIIPANKELISERRVTTWIIL